MSQPSKSNDQVHVHVNQSREEEFDVEQVKPPMPPTNLSAVEDDNDITIVPNSTDDAATAENEGADTTSSSIVSKFVSLLVNKKTAAFAMAMLGTGAIVGASVQHKQKQQKALLAAVNSGSGVSNSRSKAGKSTSFCEPERVIECGGPVITNQKVVLSDDLFCTDKVTTSTPPLQLKTLNAAIKLSGPDASIDCKGHTVRQVAEDFGSSAVYCATEPGINLGPTNRRKNMKTNCNIYYQVGIWLENGATAINCKAEQFHDGFMVLNGGEVKNSEASRNHRGFFIQGSGEISKVHAHDNNDGIRAFIPYSPFLGLGSTDADENVVAIEDEDVINEDATLELEDVDNDDVPNMSDLSAYDALDNQDGVLFDPSIATAIFEKFNVTIGNVTRLNPNNFTVDALVNQDGIGVDTNASTATDASISTAANGDYDTDTITIKGATSNNNLRDGMSLRGGGIYVKDSTTSYNGRVGIGVAGGKVDCYLFNCSIYDPTFVQFEGTVSSHHNLNHGIDVRPGLPLDEGSLSSDVNVKGVVNTYLNGVYGFYTWPYTELFMNVMKSGSWNSCQNAIEDIYVAGFSVYVSKPPGSTYPDYFTCDGDDWLVSGFCTPCPLCN